MADPAAPASAPAQAASAPAPEPASAPAAVAPETPASPALTQADVARAVQAAVAANEAKLRAKHEADKARAAEDYKTLYETEQAQRAALELKVGTVDALAQAKLTDLAPVFDADLGTVEGRIAAAQQVQKVIDQQVKARIAEKLTQAPAEKSAGTPAPVTLANMTAEQYKAYKSEKGIY